MKKDIHVHLTPFILIGVAVCLLFLLLILQLAQNTFENTALTISPTPKNTVPRPVSAGTGNVTELITSRSGGPFDYFNWYRTFTATQSPPIASMVFSPPDPDTFGPYVGIVEGNKLILGFSPGEPAQNGRDGALMVSYPMDEISPLNNRVSLRPILPMLTEQGVHSMTTYQGILNIAGVDPMDDWSMGNMYTINLNEPKPYVRKYRTETNLRGVVHVYGLTDADTNTGIPPFSQLVIGTTANLDPIPGIPISNLTPPFTYAQIYQKNPDQLGAWTLKYTFPEGEAMMYDILNYHGLDQSRLLAKVAMDTGETKIIMSRDAGSAWTTLDDTIYFDKKVKPITFKAKAIFAYGASEGVVERLQTYTLASDGNFSSSNVYLPSILGQYRPLSTYYNAVTMLDPKSGMEYLYYLVKDISSGTYGIIRTSDETLGAWDFIASIPSSTTPIALLSWPEKGKLIVTSRGTNANIWVVTPDQTSITTIPTLTATPTSTPQPPQSPVVCGQCDLNDDDTVSVGSTGADQAIVMSCLGRPVIPSITPSPPGAPNCVRADYMSPRFIINSGDIAKFMSSCGGYSGTTCTQIQCSITADVNRDSRVTEDDVTALEKSECLGSTIWSSNWFQCRVYDVFHDDQISDQDLVTIRECM